MVHVGEPVMVNPCSHEAVQAVAAHVKSLCTTDSKRKWSIVLSDGVPYVLASEVQDNFLVCSSCGMEVDKKDVEQESWIEFEKEHIRNCGSSQDKVNFFS